MSGLSHKYIELLPKISYSQWKVKINYKQGSQATSLQPSFPLLAVSCNRPMQWWFCHFSHHTYHLHWCHVSWVTSMHSSCWLLVSTPSLMLVPQLLLILLFSSLMMPMNVTTSIKWQMHLALHLKTPPIAPQVNQVNDDSVNCDDQDDFCEWGYYMKEVMEEVHGKGSCSCRAEPQNRHRQ